MAKKTIKLHPAKAVPTELFPDERPELLLNDISGTKPYNEMMALLNGFYTKNETDAICKDLRRWLRPYKLCSAQSPTHDPIADFNNLFTGFKLKIETLACIAQFAADEYNFKQLLSLMDRRVQNLWYYIFCHPYVHPTKLNQDLHHRWLVENQSYYWRTEYRSSDDAFAWFQNLRVESSYRNDNVCLMPDYLRELYAKYILPSYCKNLLIGDGEEKLPEDCSWQTYTNEVRVGSVMNVVRQMTIHDQLQVGARKMTQANVRKASKQTDFCEFFPDTPIKEKMLLAATLAVPAMTNYVLDHRKDSVAQYWTSLRTLVEELDLETLLADMLSHVKGIRVADFAAYSSMQFYYKLLLNAICTLHVGRWYDADTLQLRLFAQKDATSRQLAIITVGICYSGYLKRADVDRALHMSDAYEYFTRPMLKGLLALFASLGLVEVAYSTKAADVQEVGTYAFISYLRITQLGAFVFGLTDAYQAEGVHMPVEYFEPDPDRLLIRAFDIDGTNPYEGLLKSVAEPIGGRRYHVTPKAFLTGCTNLDDVNQKWKFITDNVFPQPSPIWEEFHRQMIRRCYPLAIPSKAYIVRQIQADDSELQRLFLTDPYLRQHTLRAENHLLLIETSAQKKVMEKLCDYGYLL